LPVNTSDADDPGVALRLAQTEETPIDPDLLRVAQAWPGLPDAIRRAVLALIGSANGWPSGRRICRLPLTISPAAGPRKVGRG
jgi:hypothetical protein